MRSSGVFRLAAALLVGLGVVVSLSTPAGAEVPPPNSLDAPTPDTSCVTPAPHGFSDVPSGAYYSKAVAWLVGKGITSGTVPGKYSPDQPVTRDQMAMFLWNMEDSPVPVGSHGFSDVPAGSYYEDAVTWLVAEGITSGTAPGKFSPSNVVTRGQMATFLWAAAGSFVVPAPHGFSDVPAGSYFQRAVTWLVAEGITSGTSPGKFSPSNVVTRGQMATFLWGSVCLPEPMVAAGGFHSCALKLDGTVACWGDNETGQVGDGTTTLRPTAVPVSGLSEVTSITTGNDHSCALKLNRTVVCWGNNSFGQLGDGSTISMPIPTSVSGLTDVVSISAAFYHTCAVKQNGTAACWGRNIDGQLGDGSTTGRLTATAVSGLTGAAKVSAGSSHSCVLKIDGSVTCWGGNSAGQVGDGSTTKRPVPTPVGMTGVTSLAAGVSHTCAVKSSGTALCWGSNYNGQLGDGTNTNRLTPTPVGGLVKAASITAGGQHTCVGKRDGTSLCWGGNGLGQLGNGSTTARLTPFPVSLSGARGISVGRYHTCAVKYDRTVACWGDNRRGALGNGTTTDDPTPNPAPVLGL
ncbi:MAG: S-layer homology domain-containing protein [Candidatus Microthrix parvicella]|jgi:alpha-tubulin suppressor-like RCC1 family protein|uniref:RCC1 domain-containing protein n=1 Tax=Candidatus Neomicrothrix sp. TaxID=2719034 RepID=UPI0025B9A222|nr:S-layer homology domain-containing protein [Candidatus Microthrix sp.]